MLKPKRYQNKPKQKGWCNKPKKLQFQSIITLKIWILSKRDESTEIDRRNANQRLCSIVFFNRGQKWWRKLNRIVTSSTLLQNGTYIYMNIGINKKTILSSFHWYGTWHDKSYIHSGSGSQSQGPDKFDASFSRGATFFARRYDIQV